MVVPMFKPVQSARPMHRVLHDVLQMRPHMHDLQGTEGPTCLTLYVKLRSAWPYPRQAFALVCNSADVRLSGLEVLRQDCRFATAGWFQWSLKNSPNNDVWSFEAALANGWLPI